MEDDIKLEFPANCPAVTVDEFIDKYVELGYHLSGIDYKDESTVVYTLSKQKG